MYYLCEKYYKPITVQYHIINGVSWVPKLALFNLQIGFRNTLLEWNSFIGMGLPIKYFTMFPESQTSHIYE